MALRYASKNILITGTVGTLFPHGLGVTPDEYCLCAHGASTVNLVLASAPDTTNVYVSGLAGGATASVFASIVHSIVK